MTTTHYTVSVQNATTGTRSIVGIVEADSIVEARAEFWNQVHPNEWARTSHRSILNITNGPTYYFARA